MNTKPIIVLVHGAWSTPASYSKLTTSLQTAGYEVHIPLLPTMNGSRPPTADLSTDIDFIRAYVQKLINSGCTILIIMHSYGGQVGTHAFHGLGVGSQPQNKQAGIAHLIYMSAYAMPENTSMIDVVRSFGNEPILSVAFDVADDGTSVARDAGPMVGAGVDEAEMENFAKTLGRWNANAMYQKPPGDGKCAWREFPVTYISTTQDLYVPFDYQKSWLQYMKAEGVVVDNVELDTGHCAGLTMTQDVVDVVNKVVAGLGK